MALEQAYQLCVGLFKQKPTNGPAYAKLNEVDYRQLLWDTTSIIPLDYKMTNFQMNGTTIETTQTPLITDLSKNQRFSSGAATPGTATFNLLRPADASTIFDQLLNLEGVGDKFLCLLMAGLYNPTATGSSTTRKYDVFFAAATVIQEDGGFTGEAGQNFTGSLTLQPTGMPVRTVASCDATLPWDTTASTGGITWAVNPSTP